MEVIEKFLDLQNALLEKGNNDGIYYPEFMAAMTWCFSPHTDLHKNYFNMTREEIMKKFTGNDDWRKPDKLGVGDQVDVRVKLDGHDYGLVTNEDEEKRNKETKQKGIFLPEYFYRWINLKKVFPRYLFDHQAQPLDFTNLSTINKIKP